MRRAPQFVKENTVPQVLNKRTASKEQLAQAIYVGRPTRWGNPYVIGKDGSRADVVRLYAQHILPTFTAADLARLRGKDLVCYCAPQK
jgi:hypothetical protein